MDEEFIPHEEAFALKELGFTELCFGVCFNDGGFTYNRIGNQGEAMCQSDKKGGKDYAATVPLYQQAFKWFRKNHNLISNVEAHHYGCELKMNRFYYKIVEKTGVGSYDTYDTYEEAELACLKKLIEIVKPKKQ